MTQQVDKCFFLHSSIKYNLKIRSDRRNLLEYYIEKPLSQLIQTRNNTSFSYLQFIYLQVPDT